ncbi:hypothetical protein [Pseudoduganella chitinolytica]|uniref:Uncharacterized protein n=1 Tax=Pseudoduganella chitinolytica TaxID=34070 RepID=A0ABY8BEM8_9BURK|nr:hypothetical protein [Pseudoduganella chitinolytica]WEF34300.1 hypothetical protein PX653_05875 [Pseudoduganella chitinolytica]
MSAYRELFRLRLEHAYHGGAWPGWAVEPNGATRALMDAAGVLTRRCDDELAFLLPSARADCLQGDDDGAAAFLLLVHAQDPLFASYTLPAVPPGQLLLADSREAGIDGVLHAGATLAERDLHGADALAAHLPTAGVPRRPALLVRIEPDAAAPARRYTARFDAASSYWKYYVSGALAGRPLAIADLDGIVAFHADQEADLTPARRARVFVSDRPIALRARPGERFVLKELGPFGERVLIKRMPVAGTGLRQRAVRDGQVVQVSEIFINQ